MYVITGRNINHVWPEGLALLREHGVSGGSRVGSVTLMDAPVTTVYLRPKERVLFCPHRDVNPFFHLFESIWMLGGSNRVEPIAAVLEKMREFSDDGVELHGAYGARWRSHFKHDQLLIASELLRDQPTTRRVVLGMWDPEADLLTQTLWEAAPRDLPCNTHIYFRWRDHGREFTNGDLGYLDMTVCCRSNDIIWGAYGANVVHLSVLQQWMAESIGAGVGIYYQISNDFHAYNDVFKQEKLAPVGKVVLDPYEDDGISTARLTLDPTRFLADCAMFADEGLNAMGYREPFITKTVAPMMRAHAAYKEADNPRRYVEAIQMMTKVAAEDWRRAGTEWLHRRLEGSVS